GTLSRRLRKPACVLLLTAVEQRLIGLLNLGQGIVKKIDGKALAVSLVSKDPDAGYGRGAGGKQLGYKLHVIWGDGPMPLAWDLSPMNVSEKRVARWLIEGLAGGGYLLADTEYDANPLYDAAQAEGFQLVAKKRKGKGLGHQRHSPSRLRSIELLGTAFGAALYRQRTAIETSFGTLVTFGGGLASLPAWVRRFHRVRHWVQAKLLIAGTRSLAKNPQLLVA
ncbi:transposase, partial [Botrimarina mediterranea]